MHLHLVCPLQSSLAGIELTWRHRSSLHAAARAAAAHRGPPAVTLAMPAWDGIQGLSSVKHERHTALADADT